MSPENGVHCDWTHCFRVQGSRVGIRFTVDTLRYIIEKRLGRIRLANELLFYVALEFRHT